MKKNNKGFTLIELLVVVAIIGILAAVGTVAYSGYTKAAKKNAAASNHASVVKYIAAELAKCNIEDTAFKPTAGEAMACDDKKTGTAEAAKDALADFKNPHSTSGAIAVTYNATAATISALEGNTVVSQSATQVTVSTCIAMDDATTPACIMKSNLISIE